MGNKSTCSRTSVDENYTRPQGLDLKEVDGRKLRRLILNRKLAPCFPGAEECTFELDECPICLLSYPSLNRSTCCSKPICTECYLRIKLEYLSWSTQCPFCKTSSYMVEYYGAKTVEERGIEQAEDQKVIETMIRIHQNELHDEKKVRQVLVEDTPTEAFESETDHTLMEPVFEVEHTRPARAAHMQGSLCEMYGNDGGDLDLEDMMLMEAIWLSMQEEGETFKDFCLAQQTLTSSSVHEEGNFNSSIIRTEIAGRGCSVPSGLSRALAAHEERAASMAKGSLWNQSSQAMEACTSFSCDGAPPVTDPWWESPDFYSARSEDGAGEASLAVVSAAGVLPVSFEDQIMMAVSLSLAEAARQARTE